MKDILKGQWNQVKGDIRRTWGDLTDDDVARTNGDVDTLIGRIQERYGIAKEQAREQVSAFLQQFERGETKNAEHRDATPVGSR